jgi:hypothetical protein
LVIYQSTLSVVESEMHGRYHIALFQQNRVRTDDYYARFSINGPATDQLGEM